MFLAIVLGRPLKIHAGRYLLSSGDRVCVPLHQLLKRDGLRVRHAGDLKMQEESARAVASCLSPVPFSLTPVLQAGPKAHNCRQEPGVGERGVARGGVARGGRYPRKAWPWAEQVLARTRRTCCDHFQMLNRHLQPEQRLNATLWELEHWHEHVRGAFTNRCRLRRAGWVTPWRGLGSAWAQDRHQTASGCPDALNAPTPHGLAQPRCIVYTVSILCFQLEFRIRCRSLEFPPSHSFLLPSLVKAVIFVLVNGWMDCE